MPRLSRRALLTGLAAAAGCTAGPGDPTATDADTDAPTTDPPATTEEFPPPSPTPGGPDSPLSLPTDTEWRQRGNTPDRRGRLNGAAIPAEPELAWSFYTPMSAPVVADGTLYGIEEGLAARDAATGRLEWRAELSGEAAAVPAVADGRLYVQRYTGMEAYNPDGGGRLWRAEFGGGGTSSPAVVDGVAYAAQGSHQTPAAVAAFGPGGERRWRVELDGDLRGSPAVVEDTVVVTTDDGTLHGVGTDGERRWTVEVAEGTTAAPAGDGDGVVYVPDADGIVRAVDAADGTELWRVTLDADGGRRPAIADGAVVVSTDGAVVCLDRDDGSRRWRTPVLRGSAEAPSADDTTVYVGETGSEGRILALDLADGSERWARWTEDTAVSDMFVSGVRGPPTLVAGGVYVVAADGIRAFRRGDGTA